jgi:farnesyl diphosphate synthase
LIEGKLEDIALMVNDTIDELLPDHIDTSEGKLFEAMRYSTLSQGKRIRPFLTMVSSKLFGVSQDASLQTAAAIELIHSYSLVHDDLPAIDNDDLRRGQPSCHKKFGEAIAILTGDALLTYAFEILADEGTHRDPSVRAELITHIARSSGFAGMVGGQVIDVLSEKKDIELSEIIRLQMMKTGALFSISCEAGAILGRASRNLRSALRAYANNVGLAFQIVDDLLDAEGTREETGKSVNKDSEAGKQTLVGVLGAKKARSHAEMLVNQANEHLSPFGSQANLLKELSRYVVNRNK